jgi:hypothetical protein
MNNRLISLALAGALSLGLMNASKAAQGTGCLPTTGTVSGLTFAQGVNAAIAALISSNSGASPPATDCSGASVKAQFWLDTSVTPNALRQYDGTSWVSLGALDSSNHLWAPPVGGGIASVTAASTTDICAAPAAVHTITGTTVIDSFGSGCPVGVRKTLIFNSATPITYNAATMILPAQRDYTAAAGDIAEALSLGAGSWRVSIAKSDGSAVTNPATPVGSVLYGVWGTIPAKTVYGTGQALSRSSYPEYFAASTRVQSGTLTAGNNTITSVPNTAGLGAGMPIEGVGIPFGTTIASVTSSTIVMSSPNTATANGVQSVRAFIAGYGTGGDSTTVGVLDCRGKTIAGRDPSALNLDAASALNSSQGLKSRLIAQGYLPNVGLSVSVSGTVSGSVNSTVAVNQGIGGSTTGGGGFAFNYPTGNGGITSTGSMSGAMAGGTSSMNGGVGQVAFPTVQPTVVAECVVAVLP